MPLPLKSHGIQVTTRGMYNYFFPKKNVLAFVYLNLKNKQNNSKFRQLL